MSKQKTSSERFLDALHKVDYFVRELADVRNSLSNELLDSTAEKLALAANILNETAPIITHRLSIQEILPKLTKNNTMSVIVKIDTDELLTNSDHYFGEVGIMDEAIVEEAQECVLELEQAVIVAANISDTYVKVDLLFDSSIRETAKNS